MEHATTLFGSVDWATEKHAACACTGSGNIANRANSTTTVALDVRMYPFIVAPLLTKDGRGALAAGPWPESSVLARTALSFPPCRT